MFSSIMYALCFMLQPLIFSVTPNAKCSKIIVPWVIAAYIIAAYTRLFHTIYTDDRIIRSILVIAIILFSINAVLIMYLTVYLPYKFPISDKHKVSASSPAFWEVYCPKVIPTMTACGVVGSFLLVRACFPIWGFFSPALLGVVALGLFFSLHFIPWPF